MATRAVHQHDDVKFHVFIPLTGKLQLTVGSDQPVSARWASRFISKGALLTDSRTLVPRRERDGDFRDEGRVCRQS
jgi:hypothetical protein